MAVAWALLVGLYGLMFAALYGAYLLWPAGWPYFLAVAIVVVVGSVVHNRGAERFALRSVAAEVRSPSSEPDLHRRIERLAQLADLPVPRLAVSESDSPNAFAVGLSPRRAVVVVTRGLRERLTGPELDAVLAHEISHIANRDAVVMTAANVPRASGETLVSVEGASIVTLLVWPLGVPMILLGNLNTLTISRCREFSADRGSAVLTGEPEALMSALQKLSDDAIPSLDLRGVSALCIVPVSGARFAWLMDHPPLEQRLAALAELARELGKPAPPAKVTAWV
jgi:heat shock protein HtpX